MRLLLVTDAVGGVWVYSLELARALKAHAVETLLAVTGPAPSDEQRGAASDVEIIDTGLPLDWMPTSPSELRRAGARIAELAGEVGADLVQTCSAALLADTRFDKPCIAVQHSCTATWWAAVKHTPLPDEFLWRRDLVGCGLNAASAVITPTAAFAAETARTYDVCRPVVAVHNGRRPPALPASDQSDFVFTASRLWDEAKNVSVLDRAAGTLNVPFKTAGSALGPNGAWIETSNLELLGQITPARMAELLAQRPIFASAALYEPFGLSALEAAHAGCALVLSDIPTHRELWSGAARFVPAEDPEAFAEAIDQLLSDRDERNALGRAAKVRAQAYAPEAMAARMATIYAGLLGVELLGGEAKAASAAMATA